MPPRRATTILCTLLALCAAPPPHARAGDHPDHRRIVRVFDFEERALGNLEDMPMHWYRVSGRGMPAYTEIGFDGTVSHSSAHSLKLGLNGGSAAAVLEPGALPAIPGARYAVTARVRTDRAVHSRARLVAGFLDEAGFPIPDAEAASPPILSNGAWAEARAEPPVAPRDAAWIVLRVEMLQGEKLRGDRPAAGPHDPAEQDIRAAAWFDDLTVFQVPRIELVPDAPAHMVRHPDRPRFTVIVDDLSGGELRAVMTLYDHRGRRIAQEQRRLDATHPRRWVWAPPVDGYGWYAAELRVEADDGLIGHELAAVSYLPPYPDINAPDLTRFMILAGDPAPAERPLLRPIVDAIGPQAVMLPVSAGAATPDEERDATAADPTALADQPDPLVMDLIRSGRPVALTIARIPADLARAAGTDADAPLDLFAADPAIWRDYLQTLLARYGPYVTDWQIGAAPAANPAARDRLDPRLRESFERYIHRPRIAMPRNALDPGPRPRRAGVTLDLPASIQPEHLPAYADLWPGDARAAAAYHLRTLPAGEFSHADRAIDLALRMIHAWRDPPGRLAIDRPWSVTPPAGHAPVPRVGQASVPAARPLPDPLLGVWVNVAEQLAGQRFVGEADLGPGITALMFEPRDEAPDADRRGGMLVVWSRDAAGPDAELALRFTGDDRPVMVDIWGNPRPIRTPEPDQTGEADAPAARITLTQSPAFIHGVDLRLARFRDGFRLRPDFAESTYTRHEHTLTVTNPWPRTLTGRMRIVGPDRWDIRPRLTDLSIPPGQSQDVPITLSFPVSEVAGASAIAARFEIDADRQHDVRLEAPIRIGLRGVELSGFAHTEPNAEPDQPADLIITLTATNHGRSARSFYAFVLPPDMPRQQSIIAPLAPNQAITRRFRFPAAAEQLAGARIRIGLRDTDGPAVLNHLIHAP